MSKSFSQNTMAAPVNATNFAQGNPLPPKLLTTYLLFSVVLTSLLTTFGCAEPGQTYRTSSLSSEHSSQTTNSSSVPDVTSSNATPPDYTYRAGRTTLSQAPTVAAPTSEVVKVNSERLVTIDGEVRLGILAKANELVALASSSKEPIDIIINSPGGSVNAGLYFIEAMKSIQSRGVVIRCHVEKLAASMAYTIFTQCTERYAMPYALLLFHAPRISGDFTITPTVAIQLVEGLVQIETVLLELIMPVMGVDPLTIGWFLEAYHNDRLFTAAELADESPQTWFKVVGKIEVGK